MFDPSEVAILHVIGRETRRCFLFGFDPVSGKNFDHRKVWIEEQLKTQAANFVYFDSNHSKLTQSTTFAGLPTRRHILELGNGSVA